MTLIRYGLGFILAIGVILTLLGFRSEWDALLFFGAPLIIVSAVVLVQTYRRKELYRDLRYELGLLVAGVVLALGSMAVNRPAAAYTVIGSAPWCAFDSWQMTCFYWSYETCQNAVRGTNHVCVPNPKP